MKKTIRYTALAVMICTLFITCRRKDKNDCPVCPSVENISPTSGKGNDTLTILGKNFASIPTTNIIKINGVQLTNDLILNGNTSQIKVRVPVDCGTGAVTVDLDDELTNFGTPPVFTYLPTFLIDSSIGGTGHNPLACIAGQGSGSLTNYVEPTGIVADPSGNVFFTDQSASCIFKMYPANNYKSSCLFAGLPFANGSTDALGTMASFNAPKYIYMDNNNNLFIAEGSSQIRVISSSGNVSTWYTNPDLSNANGIAFQSGNMNVAYVSLANHVIYRVTRNGTVFTAKILAGAKGLSGFKDGADTVARFNSPQDLVVDNAGNVFVADKDNHAIRKITPTGVVSTFAGNGVPLLADGQGTQASFNSPRGLFIDNDNTIYVADYSNNAIRKITPGGTVSTLYAFTATMASPNPRDVARDKKGIFFVTFQAGTGNGIKKITSR